MSAVQEGNKQYDLAWPDERLDFFDGVFKELSGLKDRGVFEGKNIAIVGSWNNAGEIHQLMTSLGLKLTHIADNNPNKQGVSRLGIVSRSVESLSDVENLVILVASIWYWKEIRNQLLRLGYQENRDFYVLRGGDRFTRIDRQKLLSDEAWEDYKRRARLGYEAYLQIQEKYGGKPVWLMHQPSIGDLYIFSLFLPHALGVKSIADCDCVLVVTKNSTKKLAEILGFRYIEIITFEEAYSNWLMMMRLMGEGLNLRDAVYHGLNKLFQTLVHYSQVSFRDSFTKYVFQFPEEVEPIYPAFPKRREHVLEQFASHGLLPGKTVVISPYAGHFKATISEEQWGRLISELKGKGYTVCTNCGSPEERPLPGTEVPFIDLQDCVEFVETAGTFIGVRSGFCDLVCMAKCRKIVIYETGAPAGSIEYFGFESMGLGENITELVNDCIHTDELIDKITSML